MRYGIIFAPGAIQDLKCLSAQDRISYDIVEEMVEVLTIVSKSDAATWLAEMGDGE
jgi:hypothetical protein